jgi:cytochrome b
LNAEQIRFHKILVWDLATRLFHWLTVALLIACYVSWRMNWMDWHSWTGEALLALVFFRLLWAFFGSETARFSTFLACRAQLRLISLIWCVANLIVRLAIIQSAAGWSYSYSRSCWRKR